MDVDKLLTELNFRASRSSGAGGQHVNKTSSRIEVFFNVDESLALSESEKKRLREKLASKLTQDGTLQIHCEESRSQHRNKKIAIDKLISLLKENLKVKKRRKKTKPSKSAIEKRIKSKKNNALKKKNRQRPSID